jgi:Zn-dependent protease
MVEDEPREVSQSDEDELPNDVLLEMVRIEKPPDTSKRLKIFILSLCIFLLAGIYGWDMDALVMVAIAILIHELGHIASMKVMGYTNLNILFIPLIGGGASGEIKEIDPKKEAFVSLSGPLVGLSSGILLLVLYTMTNQKSFWSYSLFAIIINYFNLLPLYPLDGGRFLNVVLFNRNYRIEFYFKLLTSCALLIIALVSKEIWLIIFFALILLTIPATRRDGKIVENLRDAYDWSADEITEEQVGIIKNEILAEGRHGRYNVHMDSLAKRIKGLWKKIQQLPMSRKSVVLFMISYALLFIIPIFLFILILIVT